jgi:glycosyltransferase involved in cell wall biosynthesis
MKVSIIIPVYNAEVYLRQCLDSVISQTLRDIEIICVNDGSNDGSLEILREYEINDSRIIVFDQQNSGAGPSRNKGIENAKGEYIAFLDPDDWYPKSDILEIMYSKAVKYHADICGGSLMELRNDEYNIKFTGLNEKYTFYEEGFLDYKDYQFDYGYWRFIYKNSFLLENNILFPSYRRFQDVPFFVKAMICARRFYALPIQTYCYRAGHKVPSTALIQLKDQIRGMTDVLRMSKDAMLSELHTITAERMNTKYFRNRLYSSLKENNSEFLSLLSAAKEQIDINLLKQADKKYDHIEEFELECVKYIEELLESPRKNSPSFHIGYKLTWLPIKMRNFLRCLKTHGIYIQ